MKLNDFFDHIYCVNLDRRPDRWDFVNQQFNKLNIDVERISAVDGNVCHFDQLSTIDHTKKRWFDLGDPAMTSNEAAILATHAHILWDAVAKGYKNILITEDDVVIRADYEEEFDKALIELPEDWDMLYLGTLDMNKPWSPNMPFSDHLEIARDRIGAHAMGVNSKMLLDLIEIVNLKTKMPVDVIYSKRQVDFKCYEMKNNIAYQYGWGSSDKGKKVIEGIGASDINDPLVFSKYLEDKYGKKD